MKNKIIIKVFLMLIMIFSTRNTAQTWEKLNPIFHEKDTLLEHVTVNFVTKNVGWISTYGYLDSGGFRSIFLETKDGGISWKLKWEFKKSSSAQKSLNLYKGNSLGEGGVSTVKLDTNNIWFMSSGGSLFFSKDMGLTWDTSSVTYENINLVGWHFTALYFFNLNKGIAFNYYRWLTSDGGYTWTKKEEVETFPNFIEPTDVCFFNDSIGWIVSSLNSTATDVGYIANTTNGGRTWTYQDASTPLMYGVDFIDSSRGYAVGTNRFGFNNGYIYSTIDGGQHWQFLRYDNFDPFYSIRFLDNLNGWVGGSGKILRTSDGGENWEIQVEGMQTDFFQLLVLKKDKVAYALGKDWNGKTHTLLRADLSNLTEVKSDINILPEEYSLLQNYPNPFNPSTTISYQIPSNSFVTLKVYDVLGNEVAVLVNEWREAGSYNIQFTTSGKQLPSGVYFYQLRAGKFTDTKKFVLLK